MERYEQRVLSSAQLRKIKKPIIERRRRERINDSMNQLKGLLLDALNKDEAQNSKMEKADILELAVSYLQNMKNCSSSQSSSAGKMVQRYQTGYSQCAREVGRFLNRSVDPGVASRVASHISSKSLEKSSLLGMTSPSECSTRVSSLPGSSPMAAHAPLYVDTTMRTYPTVPYAVAPVLSVRGQRCVESLPRTMSPQEAMEVPAVGQYMVDISSPKSNRDASPGSPVWRPW